MILAFILGVDEKQATETKTKGVVGQTGKNKPMIPKPRNIKPSAVRRIIFICNV